MRWSLVALVALLFVPLCSAASQVHVTLIEDAYAVTYTTNAGQILTMRVPFQAGSYAVEGQQYPLATPPDPEHATRIVFVADLGTEVATSKVIAAIAKEKPDLILIGGDLAYAHGNNATWAQWFDMIAPLAPSIPIMPAFGNHESYCNQGGSLVTCGAGPNFWHQRFPLPNGDKLYYAFDWGPARVTVLDTEAYVHARAHPTNTSAQAAFLKGSLDSDDARWDIVMYHRPTRTTMVREGATFAEQRSQLEPILDKGADLVLQGHVHAYERAKPLETGTVYVTSGGGGRPIYDDWGPLEPWIAKRASEHNFLVIDASPTKLSVRALRIDGTTLDEFSRERAPSTPTPAPTTSPTPSPTPASPTMASAPPPTSATPTTPTPVLTSATPTPSVSPTRVGEPASISRYDQNNPPTVPFPFAGVVGALMLSAYLSRRRARG